MSKKKHLNDAGSGFYSHKMSLNFPQQNPPSYGQLRSAVNHLVAENERLRTRIENLVVRQAEMQKDLETTLKIAGSIGENADKVMRDYASFIRSTNTTVESARGYISAAMRAAAPEVR